MDRTLLETSRAETLQNGFSVDNLPYGVFSPVGENKRVGTRLGNMVLDLSLLYKLGLFDQFEIPNNCFAAEVLNDFIALGPGVWQGVRTRLREILTTASVPSRCENEKLLYELEEVALHLPLDIGDYTDFYSSIEHAKNVGSMFRDPADPLLPNWRHLPVGYHGRSSSIVISDTPIKRPKGQVCSPGSSVPRFDYSECLDFEVELGFVVGKNTELGSPLPITSCYEAVFGVVIFNDWSARDIQRWEYVPLGPFLGKNFASSVSPWIVTLDALKPYRVIGPEQQPEPLPYLKDEDRLNFNITFQVLLTTQSGRSHVISTPNASSLYWSMTQQLAHHTSNGCPVRVGDVFASGTISGSQPDQYGCLLELTWNGTRPLILGDSGEERRYLENGDTITITAFASTENNTPFTSSDTLAQSMSTTTPATTIALGEVTGRIVG